MKKIILLLFVLLSFNAYAGSDSEIFRSLYEREWDFRISEFPSLARANDNNDYDHLIAHVSEKDQLRRYEFWKQIKLELEAISCEKLEREECINYRMFGRQIHQFLADYETRAYLIPFNSDWGFYLSWNRWGEETDFNSMADYRNYLSRLNELPVVMDEYIALMREGLRTGMTQPRVILAGREIPIRKQLVESPERSTFYKPFLNLDENINNEVKQALLTEARMAVMEGVVPAYQRLLDFFLDEYFPAARTTLDATSLPNGERFYREQIYLYATVDMSAEEIHQLGLSEVARIRAEMEGIIKDLNFDGDLAAFIEFLRTDPQFYAKTPHELLAEASYISKKIDGRLPQLFGKLPRQPYGVAPVPDNIAPFYTAGRYVDAPLSSHRGGYYWVNTYALESRTLYTLPALTLHEAVPGHHLQIALSKELGDQPDFRRNDYISAYGEGWALYAEKLGIEMGIYETPYQDFGRLTYEMWRACRLVIDTGIHAKGWSRQQAQEYLTANTALSIHEITTEVDRYISWPAQALSYKLGEYTIWQLRREAESRLGADFDLREFHDFILALGSVPLSILKDEVDRWINEHGSSNTATEPVSQPKSGISWVASAAEYDALTLQAYQNATRNLDQLIADKSWTALPGQAVGPDLPTAIILDVDETAVSNINFQLQLKGPFSHEAFDYWHQNNPSSRMLGAAGFIQAARDKGVTVFFITNRPCHERDFEPGPCPQEAITLQDLAEGGIETDTDHLMLVDEQPGWTREKRFRQELVAETHRVIMLIGDDLGDFLPCVRAKPIDPCPVATEEGRAGMALQYKEYWGVGWYILPNPMHGSWTRFSE